MTRRRWSERRRSVWKRGWTALITGLLLCPVTKVSSCSLPADGVEWSGDTCTTAYVPLLGIVTPLRYQVF